MVLKKGLSSVSKETPMVPLLEWVAVWVFAVCSGFSQPVSRSAARQRMFVKMWFFTGVVMEV